MTTKLLAIALAAGLMVGTGTSGFAQSPTSEKTPGAQCKIKARHKNRRALPGTPQAI
jgi:hypothetical protein